MTPPGLNMYPSDSPLGMESWNFFGDIPVFSPLPPLENPDAWRSRFELKFNPFLVTSPSGFSLGPLWTYPHSSKIYQPFDLKNGLLPVANPNTDFEGNPITTADRWIQFATQVGNNIYSLDLDFTDLPVNRGSKMSRFSEYSPKSELERPPNIKIKENTTARAHGEVRPIKGMKESWITRVVIDFKPNVFYMSPTLPDLEIDGFTAVDPPLMQLDFSKGRKSVLAMKGGDYSYENPQVSGSALITPFGTFTEPPPDKHNYWMFRFNPVATNLLSGIMEKTSDDQTPVKMGIGALLLWAFLPTFGISKQENFDKFHIPLDTFPRRLGDLIALLSPLFEKERNAAFKFAAPFYNPNNEYMAPFLDEHGVLQKMPGTLSEIQKINEEREKQCCEKKKNGVGICLRPIGRQPLPEDRLEAIQIGDELAKVGLPKIPARRGTILDWIFKDIAHDPERLKKMPEKPKAQLHLRMRPTTLELPFGKFSIDSTSDIRAYYQIMPVENPKTHQTETRVGIRIDIEPMNLMAVDLSLGGVVLHVDKLSAKKLVVDIPSLPGMGTEAEAERPPWTFSLQGVSAEGLKLHDEKGNLSLRMKNAAIGKVSLVNRGDNIQVSLTDTSGENLFLENKLGQLSGSSFDIPQLNLSLVFKETELQEDCKEPVKIREQRFFSLTVPEIHSKIGLNFSHKESATEVSLQGSTSLTGINFFQEKQEKYVSTTFKMDLSGNIDAAALKHPKFGSAKFSTKQGESSKPIAGHVEASSLQPRNPQEGPGKTSLDLDVNLPFVGIESGGMLTIPSGTSSLRDTKLKLHQSGELKLSVEGHLDLHKASHQSERPWIFGNLKVLPKLQDLELVGDYRLEMGPDGFRLSPPDASKDPLKLHFKIDGSTLSHRPDLSGKAIGKIPESAVIKTELGIDSGIVDLEGLRLIEFKPIETKEGEKANKLTQLDAGPVTLHHLQGQGSIWVDLFLWGFVRGFFPLFGGSPGKTKRPNPAPLTQHLPEGERQALRDLLGDGDFVRLGEVKSSLNESGEWNWNFREFLLNLHEEGGRGQFGLMRIPELNFRQQKGKAPWDLGKGKFLVNIFLNDPERGGSFFLDRWPAK